MAAVLAAGSASRFGATKQLADLAGRPLVAHAVAAATAAIEVDAVHLVVGHDAAAVTAAVRAAAPDVEVVVNPDHAAGQASSLRVAVDAATDAGAAGLVVLLGDEPDVPTAAIDAVAAALRAGTAVAVRARYDDGPGHPVGFSRAVFGRLHEVTGDEGARSLLRHLDVAEVTVPGPRPRDVDTPDDLDTVARR